MEMLAHSTIDRKGETLGAKTREFVGKDNSRGQRLMVSEIKICDTGGVKGISLTSDSLCHSQSTEASVPCDSVVKIKSVFKCKFCPKVLCLNEETLRLHLLSKRHAHSKKLYDEGKLDFVLNSDGETKRHEDEETHTERYARIMAIAESSKKLEKRKKRRQHQRQKRNQKILQTLSERSAKGSRRAQKKLKYKQGSL